MTSRLLSTAVLRSRTILPTLRTHASPHHRSLSSAGASSLIRSHTESRHVPFTSAQLYEAISDIDDYHNFVPWCTKSRVTRRLSDTHLIADLSVGFRLLSETYTSVVTLHPHHSVSADVPDSSLFKYLITDWSFKDTSTGAVLTFNLEFAFRNPLYQRITDLFFEDVVKQMVTAFEKRCHQRFITSPTTPSSAPSSTPKSSAPVFHRW